MTFVPTNHLAGHLYMYGVLTALEDLSKYVPRAQRVIGDQKFTVRLSCEERSEENLRISFNHGRCFVKAKEGDSFHYDVWFQFASYQDVEDFFTGKRFILPKVIKGWQEPWQLVTFIRLLLLMKSYLEPAEKNLKSSAEVTSAHTRLLLGVALNCLKQLSIHESFSRKIFASIPDGSALFEIKKENFAAWVGKKSGQVVLGKGSLENPDVQVCFRDALLALDIFKAKIPSIEAVGKNTILISGMIPIADGLGQIMDRVSRYIKI
jgi:hypothetical protein